MSLTPKTSLDLSVLERRLPVPFVCIGECKTCVAIEPTYFCSRLSTKRLTAGARLFIINHLTLYVNLYDLFIIDQLILYVRLYFSGEFFSESTLDLRTMS